MKISPVQNNAQNQNFKGFNTKTFLEKAAGINSVQQRLALGAVAVVAQPAIDLTNKGVDKETREISADRSIAKAVVGTLSGIAMRGLCMKAVEQALKKEENIEKLAKITAQDRTKEALEKSRDYIKNNGGIKQYSSIIGTIVALGVILVTNFVVDLPLTNKLTNFLNDYRNSKKEQGAK